MKTFISILFKLLVVTSLYSNELNVNKIDTVPLDEILIKPNRILGSKFMAKNRTGAAYYLSFEELTEYISIDVNRSLNRISGINLYEEDGFGLRPNISIRGTSPERSSKIVIMEDGIPIAPAPYSASSAYYFPSIGRMQAVEVLKGSSQIQYGPYTTGGAINFVSTEIPDKSKVKLETNIGNFNSAKTYALFGNTKENFGYMFEYLNYNSDGFKSLVNNFNSGFDISEITSKIKYQFVKDKKTVQSLELKFHHYDEISNETYLGLTDLDFNNDPFLRYPASQNDNMDAEHLQYMLTHEFLFNDKLKLTSNLYFNEFKRNWYKLDDVVFENNSQKISKVISNPEQYPNHFSIINGSLDYNSSLKVKANNRKYISKGFQTKFDYHWYANNGGFNDLEIGLRFHYDEEDRFQWEDIYGINDEEMYLETLGELGAQGNRISSAKSIASYVMYKYKINGLTVSPGIRYESINLFRDDYGSSNPDRDESSLTTRENVVSVIIPGVGFNFNLNNRISTFGGIHKGFSPPGNSTGQKAEESINIELGFRLKSQIFGAEIIFYRNDYSNLLGNDLAASGGTGELDPFNAGEALVSGLELMFNGSFFENFNATFSYTLTNAKFLSDFGSNEDIWGEVSYGDRIPYIPQHQLNTNLSYTNGKLNFNLNGNYKGKLYTQADGLKSISPQFIVDFSVEYEINSNVILKSNIINLLNKKYAVSSVPAGLRPGHPFGIFSGLQINF